MILLLGFIDKNRLVPIHNRQELNSYYKLFPYKKYQILVFCRSRELTKIAFNE